MLRLPLNGFSVIRVSGEVCISVLEVSSQRRWRLEAIKWGRYLTSNPHLHCTSEVALRPVSRQGCSGHHWAAKPNPDTNTETQPQTENTEHRHTVWPIVTLLPVILNTLAHTPHQCVVISIWMSIQGLTVTSYYVCVECMEPCLQSAVSVICDMLFWMGNSEVATIIKCYVTTSMDICHQRWT